MANKNIRSLSYRKGLDDNLFEQTSKLAKANADTASFEELAKRFMIDDSVVYGTASFYDFLKEENRSKRIHVCTGTACMVAGTQDALKDKLYNHFKKEEIGHAACVGHCHKNHAFLYDEKTYSMDDDTTLERIFNNKLPEIKQENKYLLHCNTKSVLTGTIEDLDAFYGQSEKYKTEPDKVIDELKSSNLRGRGGAGFPFWFKLDAVIKVNQKGDSQKYVVCNADEGDPGAYSDMYLLEKQPHKVLYGMYLTGLTVGANTGVLYIRGEYPDSIRIIGESISYLKKHELTPGFKFKIIPGQGSYVCGEETALLNSIEGLRPEVRVRPPYPAEYGLFGKPTVLSNVETFANIHWIMENGGKAYAQLGTKESTGTKLVSLDGLFNAPGVAEIEMGTPLNTVFNEFGQGWKIPVKGFQIGGPLGGIVPLSKINDLTVDFESFNSQGFLLGHASVVSIPEDYSMIAFLEHLMEFTALESCGKCYPCRIGSQRGMELLHKAQHENYKIDRKLFDDLLETLEIGSLCALGGGLPLPVKNALEHFDEELKTYFY